MSSGGVLWATWGAPIPQGACCRLIWLHVRRQGHAVHLIPLAAPAGDEVEGPLTDPDHPMDEDADADSPPPVLDSAARRLATSPNLAHSLPATLDLEPAQLARLRDSLYPPGDQASNRGRACLRGRRLPCQILKSCNLSTVFACRGKGSLSGRARGAPLRG